MSETADDAMAPETWNLLSKSNSRRSQMAALEPTLQRLNDRFVRHLRGALLQYVRRAVTVTPTGIEAVEYRQLLETLSGTVHLTLFNMKPLRGTLMLMFDVPLVVTLVESRFGGNGRFPINLTNRDFTPFEMKSMHGVAESALEQLQAAWEPVGQFEIETVRHETNPQFATFAAAEDLIIASTFDIVVGHGKGKAGLYIPLSGLDHLQDQLMSGIAAETADLDLRWSSSLSGSVAQAAITLNAELGNIAVSIGELAMLRPGNVFEMDRRESVIVEAGGVPLFRGRWGRHGGRIGILIEERLSPGAGVPDALASDGETA